MMKTSALSGVLLSSLFSCAGPADLSSPPESESTQKGVPPVPGRCTLPAAEHVGQPGCYLTAQIPVRAPPAEIYWHIRGFDDQAAAAAESGRYEWSVVTRSHGRIWLHILGDRELRVSGGRRLARIGPMRVAKGRDLTARFIESIFPPGMQTTVHSHPGPEGFYVVDGVQCMETPDRRQMVRAGQGFIVSAGPHVQAAPTGRRNIAVVLHDPAEPWMKLEAGWSPSGFCGT